MRHLSIIIACWHLNYDKISVKGGVGLIKVVVCKKFESSLKSYTNLKGSSLWQLKMQGKIWFCQYLQPIFRQILCYECCFWKYMLLWSLSHGFSWSKSFYHMSTPYCLSVPYYHCVSHNCNQSYTWKPYKFTVSIYLLCTWLLGGLL